jgi:hypothetical protein
VTFTQAVVNVTSDDFALTATDNINPAPSITALTPDPDDRSVYTVTVNTGSGFGSIGLGLKNGTDIRATDTDATPIADGGYTDGEPYTIALLPGDVNKNRKVNLEDAILSLKVVSGQNPPDVVARADVNNDGKIGLEEVIFVLRLIAELEIN